MFFYAYLQPEVIDEAAAAGPDAACNIAWMLRGFLQNCFLAVFEDDRWGAAIKEKLEQWPGDSNRRQVKQLLVQMRKRKRLLFCLVPDYEGTVRDLDRVFEQASQVPLDLIMVVSAEETRRAPEGVTLATRTTYQGTAFETMRSRLLESGGRTCQPREMTEAEFLDFHFHRALRYATEIQICDRICGKKNYADNYKHTTERLMVWLEKVLKTPESCKIIFHLGQPAGKGDAYIRAELAGLMKGRLASADLEVRFYDESLPDASRPHQRFLLTDQVALNIDRGLDFLDRRTRRNRDSKVSYQNVDDARALLESYAARIVGGGQ